MDKSHPKESLTPRIGDFWSCSGQSAGEMRKKRGQILDWQQKVDKIESVISTGEEENGYIPEKTLDILDIDQEEVDYYKQKLGITQNMDHNCKESNNLNCQQNQEFQQQCEAYLPASDVKLMRKPIHEYAPYVLGPNDCWPPKYPHSMKQFKLEMRYQRRLK